jgi:ribose 5-phosphate isomerase B
MKIGIASDHAGFEYKQKLILLLQKKGFEVKDYGTYSENSCDYPDFAHALGSAIDRKEVELGVALCGSGNGINMTLNKHQGVRAALCWISEIARLAKAHNNANVLVMPARFISYAMATRILNTWLTTDFEGGRHQRRIDKIPVR